MIGYVDDRIESLNLVSIVHAMTVIAGCMIYQQQSPNALWNFYGLVVVAVILMDVWVGGQHILRRIG